ncbi:ABC transporter permease [Legionella sp. km772]|uniref:ABC transporter permease n=1 Tax=Legionella sp. km772 TaxID=2498111 RepID=UPI000F8C8B63|nr:ABC transporter permease [Legionella sp. km772]RUR12934.1 ABC transporter permease [Legionella sp. km772]
MLHKLSLQRISGLILKEFTLITRDRGTIAMLVILPIMLLILFGYAINLDPKNLPTAIVNFDHTPLTRTIIANLHTSKYFNIIDTSNDMASIRQQLDTGKLSFAMLIPPDFTRKYIRGDKPQFLVEIDGSDPGSSAGALGNVEPILNLSLEQFAEKGLEVAPVNSFKRSVDFIIHRLYNETNISAFNIVPGLIGVLLTLTMVMLTSTAITSEFEAGTMELLLSTPLLPTEIILGKVIPYVVLGYLQLTSVLIFSKILIHIPIQGSLILLYLSAAPFIIANLMVGMIFSTLSKSPMQAMQLSVFYQLPSMFLSGYIFSFYGMPQWAQTIGACLPMTYFMRITRGIMLKGNGLPQVLPNIIPILIIAFILVLLTSKVFRTTLD